ncbi:MAG: alanyl-tRNA ligase [Parcubacteria group bacterium Gr01-1014_2]|nr:MAG: alanyl-tRNA ligase [Parcubacteria group bacterium Gr01-1014_2]
MGHQEIRKKFLDFFEKRGHKVVPSSSLIPDDPSVLFTTAGVQQFKPYYTGQKDSEKDFGTRRIISIQKSLRTTDIDEVGDESHTTFFEMLGYFSFGDYFKKETIEWTYNFLVNKLGFFKERLRPTVFGGDGAISFDKESFETWKSLGFQDQEIGLGNRKDNFWGPIGNDGPCGPANEIYVDDIEIGTLVFNEYYCDKEKHFLPLTQKGVDVGLGFERMAMFLQNVKSVYETDLFMPIITELRGKNLYDYETNERSERIIADHLKASAFVISDGVMPSNVERGYVLRRLIRKVMRHSKKLNLSDDFIERSLKTIINIYKEYYPDLKENGWEILDIFNQEFKKFGKALEKGIKEFEKGIIQFKNNGIIPGSYAFNIQQSLGVTLDIIQDIAKEKGMEIDFKAFKEAEKKHKEISRISQEKKFRK